MWLRMVRKSEESSNSFWLKGLGELSFVCRKIKRFWNSAIEVSFDLELIENRGFGSGDSTHGRDGGRQGGSLRRCNCY